MIRTPSPLSNTSLDRQKFVLWQAIPYNPRRWRKRLRDPDAWPDALKERGEGGRWPTVNREQVFVVGEAATNPRGAVHTYVAAAVWGTGTSAQGVDRAARVLDDDPSRVGQDLAHAAQLQASDGPVAAYGYLHGDGNRIKHLGPSFGTKFLYFAGFDANSHHRQALILDKNVASALVRLDTGDWPDHGWLTEQYARYLDIAHDWAEQWQTPPDVVERALFSIGRADPVAVLALAHLANSRT